MSKANRHLVDTVVFDFAFDSQDCAFEQQAGLDDFVKRRLLTVVDDVFSATFNGDKILRIASLEVDLGVVGDGDYHDQLPQRLREKLGSVLGQLYIASQQKPTPSEVRLSSSRDHEREQMEYFLANGRMPWNAKVDADGLSELIQRVVSADGDALVACLRGIGNRKALIGRLVRQFPEATWFTLLGVLARGHAPALTQLLLELKRVGTARQTASVLPMIDTGLLMSRVWESVFAVLLQGADASDIDSLMTRVLQEVLGQEVVSDKALHKTVLHDLMGRCDSSGSGHALKSVLQALLVTIEGQLPVGSGQRPDNDESATDTQPSLDPERLGQGGSRFTNRSYLASLIRQMTANDKMSYELMLSKLCDHLTDLPAQGGLGKQLPQVLSQVGQELRPDIEATDPSGAESTASYDLYDQLRSLFEDVATTSRADSRGMEQVIAQLSGRYPWQLLKLLRQLQSDLLPWEKAVSQMPARLLQRLVTSLLELWRRGDLSGQSHLIDAVALNAERCADRDSYYRRLLACLIRSDIIDFEMIIAQGNASAPQDADAGLTGDSVSPSQAEESMPDHHPSAHLSDQGASKKVDPLAQASSQLNPTDSDQKGIRENLAGGINLSVTQAQRLIHTIDRMVVDRSKDLGQLLEGGIHDAELVTRLIELLPERLLARLLPRLGLRETSRLLQCAELLTTACCSREMVADPAQLERLKWQYLFSEVKDTGYLFSERLFVQGYIAYLIDNTQPIDAQTFCGSLSQQLAVNILPSTEAMTVRIIDILSQKSGPKHAPLPKRRDGDARDEQRQRNEDQQPQLENIYISNAGLVLATPYLPRLFEMLGLTEQSAFQSQAAAIRGVHMLQFLVNANNASPEYLLVLNKLLCGITIEEPIDLDTKLAAHEMEMLEGLLQGMIQNWKALGNTSIAGLRESFLQREGRLQFKGDAWHLLVQPKPFDMLLDQIPWGYRTIRYPWMERVIYVDWR